MTQRAAERLYTAQEFEKLPSFNQILTIICVIAWLLLIWLLFFSSKKRRNKSNLFHVIGLGILNLGFILSNFFPSFLFGAGVALIPIIGLGAIGFNILALILLPKIESSQGK